MPDYSTLKVAFNDLNSAADCLDAAWQLVFTASRVVDRSTCDKLRAIENDLDRLGSRLTDLACDLAKPETLSMIQLLAALDNATGYTWDTMAPVGVDLLDGTLVELATVDNPAVHLTVSNKGENWRVAAFLGPTLAIEPLVSAARLTWRSLVL